MLHEALRLIRVYHDMKQAELAAQLGISKSYMSEIEKGVKSPSVELINKYAEIFGIPASSILFFSENMDKPMAETTVRQARTFVATKIIKLLQFLEERSGHAHIG
ncbi:MAG TPA: helix-turn-helix transcriptional regulator [Roseiarcus sp.]|jgi:transcriptional regulator with XRE-family HTH domain